MTDAPSCPVSFSQAPSKRRLYADAQPPPLPKPVIPAAVPHDLPSLLRTVNIMRDVLRQYTSTLTVNNLYLPRAPFFRAEGDTYYSKFPEWDQKTIYTSDGYVYHHGSDVEGGVDENQRVRIRRQNAVEFQNRMQNDPEFFWSYSKPLDLTIG